MRTRVVVPFETFLFGSCVSFRSFSKNYVLEKNYLAYMKACKFQKLKKTKTKPQTKQTNKPQTQAETDRSAFVPGAEQRELGRVASPIA